MTMIICIYVNSIIDKLIYAYYVSNGLGFMVNKSRFQPRELKVNEGRLRPAKDAPRLI